MTDYVDYLDRLPDQSNEYIAKELQLWLRNAHEDREDEEEIIKANWEKFTYTEKYTHNCDATKTTKTYGKRAHDVHVKFNRPLQTLSEAFFNYGETEDNILGPNLEHISVLNQFETLPHSLYIALHRREISDEKGPDGRYIVHDVHDPIGCPLEIDFSTGGFYNAISSTCKPKKYMLVGVQVARADPDAGPGMHQWWGYVRRMYGNGNCWFLMDDKKQAKARAVHEVTVGDAEI